MGNGGHATDLWSWQTVGIELAGFTPDHGKCPYCEKYPKYPELCEQLAKRLGLDNDQFIWCENQAGVVWEDRKKWKLSVPKGRVRLICTTTWHWILEKSHGKSNGCCPPKGLFELYKNSNPALVRNDFHKQFDNYWKVKTTKLGFPI
jgi:hypothetical protein